MGATLELVADVGQVVGSIAVVLVAATIFYIPVRIRRSIKRYERTGRRDRWTAPQIPDGIRLYGTMSPQSSHDVGRPGTLPSSGPDHYGEV